MGFTDDAVVKKPHRDLFSGTGGKKKKKKKKKKRKVQTRLAFEPGVDKQSLEIDLTGDDEQSARGPPPESSYETSSYDVDQDMSK